MPKAPTMRPIGRPVKLPKKKYAELKSLMYSARQAAEVSAALNAAVAERMQQLGLVRGKYAFSDADCTAQRFDVR